ncbi:T9SS type A sorting domain-containing protein [Rubrivirga sp. IMCC45206]|uniref:T9SS type A sorting domain-containing protein n=1 Tax=Rubrivirga sp. IMCC45206 TaxID=3391614 RepID=UPI0039902D89
MLLLAVALATSASAQPINDDLWTSEPIFGTAPSSYTGTTVGASRAITELASSCNGGDNSVWWIFATSDTGTVTIDLAGSDFDTVVDVFRQTPLGGTLIDCNDDGASGTTSTLTVPVEVNAQYFVRVSGYLGAEGAVAMTVDASASVLNYPPDDAFMADGNLTIQPGYVHLGTNVNATFDPGEPLADCAFGGAPGENSVWRYYPHGPAGTLTIHTGGSGFDTILAVYDETGAMVACNDQAGDLLPTGGADGESYVEFETAPGVAYFVQVVGWRSDATSPAAEGRIQYSVSFAPPVAAEDGPDDALTFAAPMPNPTAGAVRLAATLAAPGAARVEVFDALGRSVAVVHDGPVPSGTTTWTWAVSGQPAGVYAVRLTGEGRTATRTVTVVR